MEAEEKKQKPIVEVTYVHEDRKGTPGVIYAHLYDITNNKVLISDTLGYIFSFLTAFEDDYQIANVHKDDNGN